MPKRPKDESVSETLGRKIARDIFTTGDGPRKCKRIQFMGMDEFGKEHPNGGFCEEALAESIAQSIRGHM